MLFLLPPSETKRAGGDPDRPLDLASLSRQQLTRPRRAALARLRELSSNLTTAARALGLGPRTAHEAAINRDVRTGPTMPAIERFDGVLYDALDAASLPDGARRWADEHVAIASALFGLLAPEDRIPAYRLSAATRVPGGSLRAIWSDPVASVLAAESAESAESASESVPILDLRSEAYAELGPAPSGARFLRVMAESVGRRRALNHTNKAAKGRLIRTLALADVHPRNWDELIEAAAAGGIRMEYGAPGELDLIVDDAAARRDL